MRPKNVRERRKRLIYERKIDDFLVYGWGVGNRPKMKTFRRRKGRPKVRMHFNSEEELALSLEECMKAYFRNTPGKTTHYKSLIV